MASTRDEAVGCRFGIVKPLGLFEGASVVEIACRNRSGTVDFAEGVDAVGLGGRGSDVNSGLTKSYSAVVGAMKGITVKLPAAVARRLREQARQSGRSVAALIRERLASPPRAGGTVYSITADLAGSLAGGRLPVTSARARFRRS